MDFGIFMDGLCLDLKFTISGGAQLSCEESNGDLRPRPIGKEIPKALAGLQIAR